MYILLQSSIENIPFTFTGLDGKTQAAVILKSEGEILHRSTCKENIFIGGPIVTEKLTALGIIDQQIGGDELPLLPLFL